MTPAYDYILLHFHHLYPKARALSVQYGENPESRISIKKYSGDFFEQKNPRLHQIVWKTWRGERIPFFFEESDTAELVTYHPDGSATINYDLIASAFYLLSGWQEYHGPERDQFGRYPYKASVQARHQFITRPIVNYYFEILREVLERVYTLDLRHDRWGNNSFATCLTHDIDRLHSAWKVAGLPRLKSGDLKEFTLLQLQNMFSKDPWNNLPEVMVLAEQFGAKATFFFLPGTQLYNGHPNADYDLRKPEYQKQIKEIAAKGHEVAIHGSFGTATDVVQLKAEMRKLPLPVNGNRFHYLCHLPEETTQVLEQSRLQYDTTLGFAEHFGFRNSYCHPFFPYNFKTQQAHTYLELPLNLMDTTLYGPNYLNMRPSVVLAAVSPMVQEVIRFKGLFTVLWHNENISRYPEYPLPLHEPTWRDVLLQLLEQLQQHNTGFYTCSEAAALVKG